MSNQISGVGENYNTGSTVVGQPNKAATSMMGDFSDFLKLLTAQLKYQDPTSPMDMDKFTNQLVMFSQLEQSVNQTNKLDTLLHSLSRDASSNLLGREVTLSGNKFYLDQGDTVSLGYTLPEAVDGVSLEIYDQGGNLVALSHGDSSLGQHEVKFAGKNSLGEDLSSGVYHFRLVPSMKPGTSMNEDDLRYTVSMEAKRLDHDSKQGEDILRFGSLSFDLGQILSVRLKGNSPTNGVRMENMYRPI